MTVEHWQRIYQQKSDSELGWFEPDFEQSLKFIDMTGLKAGANVFVPGAGTSGLVDLLHRKGFNLSLNDLSESALSQIRKRMPEADLDCRVGSIAQPLSPALTADLWFDRAVLHFLQEASDIRGYFNNVRASVKPGGYVLLAEFAKGGATRCAGLDVTQYDVESMQAGLGQAFRLISCDDHVFLNPFGQTRPYVYALFQRI